MYFVFSTSNIIILRKFCFILNDSRTSNENFLFEFTLIRSSIIFFLDYCHNVNSSYFYFNSLTWLTA